MSLLKVFTEYVITSFCHVLYFTTKIFLIFFPFRPGFPLRPDLSKADVGRVGCFFASSYVFFTHWFSWLCPLRSGLPPRPALLKAGLGCFDSIFCPIKDFWSIGSQWFLKQYLRKESQRKYILKCIECIVKTCFK